MKLRNIVPVLLALNFAVNCRAVAQEGAGQRRERLRDFAEKRRAISKKGEPPFKNARGVKGRRSGSTSRSNKASSAPKETLIHKGVARSYAVRVPWKDEKSNGLFPLVFVLHGGGGNAENAERMTGFTEKAEQEGFIVVYPEGTGRHRGKLLTWNAGHCCGYARESQADDVGFFNALTDKMLRDYSVDPRRVYVTGMSNGGMMAHRLGMELPGRFAAIAPVVSTIFGDELKPDYPVSALMINGALDKNVPPQGGPPGKDLTGAWDGTPAKPAIAQAMYWASANGCKAAPDKIDSVAFTLWRYHCPAGLAVESYLVKNNGHAWPGGLQGSRRGDIPTMFVKATDLIWDFFKAHPK